MKQSELIERVATKGKMTKAEARRMVDLIMGELESGVKEVRGNGSVTIPRLGTFRITSRAARMGRNPRTGEPMHISAGKSLRLRPAANLRKAAGC
ncbi:MAG: HU family DNA-binding protein [Kiloniellales bacterium]